MNVSYTFLLNHLLQSTLFAIAAALLAFSLRNNRAEVRFRVWLAASVKFLVPFSWIANVGRSIKIPAVANPTTPVVHAARQLERSFTLSSVPAGTTYHAVPQLTNVLLTLWAVGAAIVLVRWAAAWFTMHRMVRASRQTAMNFPTPVRISSAPVEPGIFGIMRPVLLLPEQLTRSFETAELDAILAHELCHVRRRDNLTAALHTLIQALFWFHPAVWIIGSKLLEERELACDQEVLRAGTTPESYAGGILRVCRLCLEPAGACAAGVSGANLRKRIEAILRSDTANRLSRTHRMLIAASAVLALSCPLAIGVLQAQHSHAEEQGTTSLSYEVATVRPSNSDAGGGSLRMHPGGGVSVRNMPLQQIIGICYEVPTFQVTGGPSWMKSDRFDIEAKTAEQNSEEKIRTMTAYQRAQLRKNLNQRLRSLLADRFHLIVKEEMRESPAYSLTVAKGGSRLVRSDKESEKQVGIYMQAAIIRGTAVSITTLADALSGTLSRPVVDRTGLEGKFDWKLEWNPDSTVSAVAGDSPNPPPPSGVSGPSIFTALQEQLGLRLESQKAPARVIVVESASKPTAN